YNPISISSIGFKRIHIMSPKRNEPATQNLILLILQYEKILCATFSQGTQLSSQTLEGQAGIRSHAITQKCLPFQVMK
ncbi:hypothetical protein KC19_10G148000, partial [Ceratodon purpureus]